ncbi:MAG TPA: hypothetical protein VD996_14480 [Chitinophagaceae bacterium]|nr:hypothetical protein [Chitinophagaceae bacterium]
MLSKSKEKHLLQVYFNTKNSKNVPSHIAQLGAPDSDITDEELHFITKYVVTIDRVFLSNSFVTEEGLLLLKKLRQVCYLDLTGLPLNDENLDCILHFDQLEYLDVNRTKISPHGIYRILQSFPKLETLIASIPSKEAHFQPSWEKEFPRCHISLSITD